MENSSIILDNVNELVKGDLEKTLKKGGRLSVAATCFSMYAFNELKKNLEELDEFRFIFTSQAFLDNLETKEFCIPKLNAENSLYGSEFEIKLRNELTQKAVARECVEWIKRKAVFKRNNTGENMNNFMTVESDSQTCVYSPIQGFTTVELGCERGNNLSNLTVRMPAPQASRFLEVFDKLWNDKNKLVDITDTIIDKLSKVYKENSPEFIYFMTLNHIFSEFLKDISEDDLPNEATGFKQTMIWNKLFDFQKDAALAIISKLEKYNGCILADSVGLGKTFTALAVIKYYEGKNKSVLVLCPKKLANNWNTYKDNYKNNPIADDKLRYDVLFHTDLSRASGKSNGLDLERLNWGNYDLIVIDESHNFRNGYGTHANKCENRYSVLMNKVICAGVKTKVLMLSATPVNNHFDDLKNQLSLAYGGDTKNINPKLNSHKDIDDIFKAAQSSFNKWVKLCANERKTSVLINSLDFSFFELLDSVTIARSRKQIEQYYDISKIGKFPKRLSPISIDPKLTDSRADVNYNDIYECLTNLTLRIFTPFVYILETKKQKYLDHTHNKENHLTQDGREEGLRVLNRINLLKRLESSSYSFQLTLNRSMKNIDRVLNIIDKFEKKQLANPHITFNNEEETDLDVDDDNNDLFVATKTVDIDLRDMDYISWKHDLETDRATLIQLLDNIKTITPDTDSKLKKLFDLIDDKIAHPINTDNKKILIFTAFADTAEYLYEEVSAYVKNKYGLNTAVITGSIEGRSTIKGLKADLNNILTCFSPLSKEKDTLMPGFKEEIDILIATDCVSEGQNLQDCDFLVNYDIHWNPVRIIQRFGRIDRIGSKNKCIQLVNFWPDISLDDYIKLKARVETKMKVSVMTSSGDDDPINDDEEGDLEYRKEQLQRLREEVPNIEDISNGISIMDLGLNEYRLDLLEYYKDHHDLDKKPKGLHAVVNVANEMNEGVIFVLKNSNKDMDKNKRNHLHPFYMVFIASDGTVVCDYLHPKKLLDIRRSSCRGQNKPIQELCKRFNKETNDGRNMDKISELLNKAITSIIQTKEESDLDSLFREGGTSILNSNISGLNDFELISFIVVRKGE